MTEEELEPPADDAPETHAIRRVREIVAQTQLIQRDLSEKPVEEAKKANVDWQLHVWSGPRKATRRPLGMAEMGGAKDARPNDAARARKPEP